MNPIPRTHELDCIPQLNIIECQIYSQSGDQMGVAKMAITECRLFVSMVTITKMFSNQSVLIII